jgi:hypothetical protein
MQVNPGLGDNVGEGVSKAKSYKLKYPNASREELYYVSDFQTFADLPEMPDRVREWLLTNFKDRFVDNN